MKSNRQYTAPWLIHYFCNVNRVLQLQNKTRYVLKIPYFMGEEMCNAIADSVKMVANI